MCGYDYFRWNYTYVFFFYKISSDITKDQNDQTIDTRETQPSTSFCNVNNNFTVSTPRKNYEIMQSSSKLDFKLNANISAIEDHLSTEKENLIENDTIITE